MFSRVVVVGSMSAGQVRGEGGCGLLSVVGFLVGSGVVGV
jgi:hypothetical protein